MSWAKGFGAVRLVICGGLIGLLASALPAADRYPGGRRVYAIVDRFKQALTHVTLTDSEKPLVDAIMEKAAARRG